MDTERPNPAILQIALALDELAKAQSVPLQHVANQLTHLDTRITQDHQQSQGQFKSLAQQLKNLESIRTLLESVSDANRKLTEQFYDEQIIEPMVRSLFPLVDFTIKAGQALEKDTSRYQLALGYFTSIRTQLDQFLVNFGIERFQHRTEEPFNPKVMKPIKTIQTRDERLSGLIAESLLCGFKKQERILRAETVSLFKCEDTSTEERN